MSETTNKKCPQCWKLIESPVLRTIIDRGWDSISRRQYVRERTMEFCSEKCGEHYQMGCEG